MSIKAQVTAVQVGIHTVEGLMAEGGRFGVAVPQYADIFETSRNTASRDLKRLLAKVSQTSIELEQWKTPFNQKAVNVIPLESWSRLIVELAISGNEKAIEILRDLNDLGWHQLFCDAFHVKFTEEDRQNFLRERQLHRPRYHPLLTFWLQKDDCVHGWEYGRKVNEFKEASKLPIICIDEYSADEMSKMNRSEAVYNAMRTAGHTHKETLRYLV